MVVRKEKVIRTKASYLLFVSAVNVINTANNKQALRKLMIGTNKHDD